MRWLLVILLVIVPAISSAKLYETPSGKKVDIPEPKNIIWKNFTLPSGISYVAIQLIPIARAGELTLREEIQLWLSSYAKQYNISEDYFYRLAKCESGFDVDIFGDKGKAFGLFQWWEHSWKYYNKKFKTDLDRNNWKHQVEMSARVISLEGYDNWINCFYFIRFGKWK